MRMHLIFLGTLSLFCARLRERKKETGVSDNGAQCLSLSPPFKGALLFIHKGWTENSEDNSNHSVRCLISV